MTVNRVHPTAGYRRMPHQCNVRRIRRSPRTSSGPAFSPTTRGVPATSRSNQPDNCDFINRSATLEDTNTCSVRRLPLMALTLAPRFDGSHPSTPSDREQLYSAYCDTLTLPRYNSTGMNSPSAASRSLRRSTARSDSTSDVQNGKSSSFVLRLDRSLSGLFPFHQPVVVSKRHSASESSIAWREYPAFGMASHIDPSFHTRWFMAVPENFAGL